MPTNKFLIVIFLICFVCTYKAIEKKQFFLNCNEKTTNKELVRISPKPFKKKLNSKEQNKYQNPFNAYAFPTSPFFNSPAGILFSNVNLQAFLYNPWFFLYVFKMNQNYDICA